MCSFDSSSTVNPTQIGGFNVRVATLHCMTVKQSVIGLPLQKVGLVAKVYVRDERL